MAIAFTVNVLYNIYFPTILSFVVNGVSPSRFGDVIAVRTSIFGSSRDTAID